MTAVYDVTSRPFIQDCHWIWPRNEQSDQNHFNSAFTNTNAKRSFFVIHPDWLSEEVLPAAAEGRRHRPWLWEYHGARREYPTLAEDYRRRIREEMDAEARVSRLHQDKHYKVGHSSPFHVNNPAEVHDSNVLYKVSPVHVDPSHLKPWNNARRTLYREVSLPPLEQRIRPSNGGPGTALNAGDVHNLRRMQNQYRSYCDW